jgi:hypothetical protein
VLPECLAQFFRPEQAADVIGMKRRRHGSRNSNVP